jgi:hypothetical protein
MLRTSCCREIILVQSSAPLSTLGRRSLSPSARSERSPTLCFETSLWYPGEGPSSIFVLTTPETIRSSSRRQEDSRQRTSAVHPGSERHVDLLHVDWPARDEIDIARKWSESVPIQLDLTPKPTGGQDILDSGTYEISLEVRARNADAARYAIPVCWDGKWSGKAAMWITSALSRRGRFGERSFGSINGSALALSRPSLRHALARAALMIAVEWPVSVAHIESSRLIFRRLGLRARRPMRFSTGAGNETRRTTRPVPRTSAQCASTLATQPREAPARDASRCSAHQFVATPGVFGGRVVPAGWMT